jgi:hypothetical protein
MVSGSPAAVRPCPGCTAATAVTAKFCAACGSPQPPADTCPSCGALAQAGPFCSECGHRLVVPPEQSAAAAQAPTSERKVTSVLFGDLVGFTPLSESRDAEDIRDLLSSYFQLARTIIARYGGTVEKFIGDAVMAVWGGAEHP